VWQPPARCDPRVAPALPGGRLIFQFAFFAGLTALLYHHDIVPYVIAPGDTPAFERIFLALDQDQSGGSMPSGC